MATKCPLSHNRYCAAENFRIICLSSSFTGWRMTRRGEQAKQGAEAESTRGRSTINFPYSDQDDAVEVATAVHVVGGTSCDWDQLAAQMKQAAGGGGFRIRVMAARAVGLLTYDRGSVSLTDLGIRIVDPKFARIARAQSFLEVELFKTMYEKLKGGMLPPVAAIERAMEAAGVCPKQKDKARQVVIRSARPGLPTRPSTREAAYRRSKKNRYRRTSATGAAAVAAAAGMICIPSLRDCWKNSRSQNRTGLFNCGQSGFKPPPTSST